MVGRLGLVRNGHVTTTGKSGFSRYGARFGLVWCGLRVEGRLFFLVWRTITVSHSLDFGLSYRS